MIEVCNKNDQANTWLELLWNVCLNIMYYMSLMKWKRKKLQNWIGLKTIAYFLFKLNI